MQGHLRQTLLPLRHSLQELDATTAGRRDEHKHARLCLRNLAHGRAAAILKIEGAQRDGHAHVQLLAVLVVHRLGQDNLRTLIRRTQGVAAAYRIQGCRDEGGPARPEPAGGIQ